MKRKITIIALIFAVLIQLAVPVTLIKEKYDILENGAEYKFRVVAYAVGKKIKFNITDIDWATQPSNAEYGIISVGSDGFAEISSLVRDRPTAPFVKSSKSGEFEFPVSCIKLDARAYESLFHKVYEYGSEVYIKVKIKNGKVVVENMYVNDETIEEYLQRG